MRYLVKDVEVIHLDNYLNSIDMDYKLVSVLKGSKGLCTIVLEHEDTIQEQVFDTDEKAWVPQKEYKYPNETCLKKFHEGMLKECQDEKADMRIGPVSQDTCKHADINIVTGTCLDCGYALSYISKDYKGKVEEVDRGYAHDWRLQGDLKRVHENLLREEGRSLVFPHKKLATIEKELCEKHGWTKDDFIHHLESLDMSEFNQPVFQEASVNALLRKLAENEKGYTVPGHGYLGVDHWSISKRWLVFLLGALVGVCATILYMVGTFHLVIP